MENLHYTKKQSSFQVLYKNKNINALTNYSSNVSSSFLKSNNSILNNIAKTTLEKTDKNCYLNIVPFDKVNFSQLHPINGSLSNSSRNIYNQKKKQQVFINHSSQDSSKIQTSNNLPYYSKSVVEKILKTFLDSKKINTHIKDVYHDKSLIDFSNELSTYSQIDVNNVINNLLTSKITTKKASNDDSCNLLQNDISTNTNIFHESSVTKNLKEILDSKTKFQEKDGNYLFLFDYSNDVINIDVLKNLQNSKCKDLIKHPFIMNFIDEKLINKKENCLSYFIISLNFLISLYCGTIISPNIFTIISGIEIFLYFMYFLVSLK
ncbi:Hypothetical protein SRAE_1000296800 [Strongyloides ratti]|uniref:Uncharacterized protein n=1 Tax=Strongyloides ratti TaxID=34506 RepID=A0A090LB53_STRRB|nr:Hypothetical protein SRAE_1000296800 [Strongyloides ratti]CEF64715.1 Hypothetical protein SRAE_1000296800 [Strongyloides ratti]